MSSTETVKKNRGYHALIFLCVILVKVLIMGLFSSDYQDRMFIPFVRVFLEGSNPYEYYYQNHLLPSFPYFPIMLFIESFGGLLLTLLQPASVFVCNLLFKLPVLLMDLIGFWCIRSIGVRFKYAMVFYFCSPIILFGTYVHGQLDIIPTVLLMLAVCFLIKWKKRYNLLCYSIFLGLAIGCKAHILAAVPILFLYIEKKRGIWEAVKYHAISALLVMLYTAGFWGEGFIQMVLLNKEQSALTVVNLDYGAVYLALPILFLAIVYLNVYELNYFNRNLLMSMLAMLFSVFLISLSPMPAWYIWAVPFYAVYFSFAEEDKYKMMTIYAGYNVLYMAYFVFLHKTEYTDIILLGKSMQYLKISQDSLKTVVFTLMVACLIVMVLKIYKFGIASNNLYKKGGRSFVIGIAGDSGAGKTRLLGKIEHLFGGKRDILFIEGDGDHRWARGDENWEQYTALDPKANYLYRQADNIRELKRGNAIYRSEYDHETGDFTEQKRIQAKKYIVLCGLHSLYLPALREELDLKIFMNTDTNLRNYWKINRDREKRGYTKEAILAQIEKRIPDAEKYIYPQMDFADLIITYFDKTLTDPLVEEHDEVISVKLELNINMNLEPVIKSFSEFGIAPEYAISDDLVYQSITFDGSELLKEIDYGSIAENNIPQYEDFFTYYPEWGDGVDGLVQFFLLYVMSAKMRG